MNAVVFIPLTQGQIAIIDFEDFASVRLFNWHAEKKKKTYYASCNAGEVPARRVCYLHRFILGSGSGWVDHRNGNGLDCTRGNLRTATPTQNGQNKTKRAGCLFPYKGIYRKKSRYVAGITKDGVYQYLGCFGTPEQAAKAYDRAATELFGPFAKLNFGKP